LSWTFIELMDEGCRLKAGNMCYPWIRSLSGYQDMWLSIQFPGPCEVGVTVLMSALAKRTMPSELRLWWLISLSLSIDPLTACQH
jgi:hypothetical protein